MSCTNLCKNYNVLQDLSDSDFANLRDAFYASNFSTISSKSIQKILNLAKIAKTYSKFLTIKANGLHKTNVDHHNLINV